MAWMGSRSGWVVGGVAASAWWMGGWVVGGSSEVTVGSVGCCEASGSETSRPSMGSPLGAFVDMILLVALLIGLWAVGYKIRHFN